MNIREHARSLVVDRPVSATQSLLNSTAILRFCRASAAAITLTLAATVLGGGSAQAQYVYVSNFASNNLTVIDSATNTRIGPALPVGLAPDWVTVSNDQSFAYVVNFGGNSVSIIDTATNTVTGTIAVGPSPSFSTLSPDGKTLYVTNNNGTVSVVDLVTRATTHTITVGFVPSGLKLTPDGQHLYVANSGSASVSVIATTTNTVQTTIAGVAVAGGMTMSPDGTTVYIATASGITPIDTATNVARPEMPIGAGLKDVTVSLDGKTLYAVDWGHQRVAVIDAASQTTVFIPVGNNPLGIVLSPDGKTAYVANNIDNTVSVIDTVNKIVTATVSTTGTSSSAAGMCGNGSAYLAAGRTFVAKQDNALGCTGAVAVFTGGTLQIAKAGLTSAQPILLDTGGGIIDTNGFDATLNGSISGTGGLTKNGQGILTLGGASNYTGATLVNLGTLAAGAADVFSSGSAYTVANGAGISLNGFDQTIGSLSGAGTVVLGTATLTAGADDTSTTFSGEITGNGGLTKIGRGTMTLSGVNDYSGATIVNDGTLRVNGALLFSSGVTVNAQGILGGNGNINSAVTINGSFAPGDGITPGSSITVQSLAFASGAQYMVSLTPSTSTSANVVGTATLGGAKVVASFAPVTGYVEKQYKILTAGSVLTDTFASTVQTNGLPSGFKTSLKYDANNVWLDLALDILPPSGPAQNGVNINQRNVANAAINFFNTTGHIPMAFGALTPNGLTQASGEIGTASQQTSFQATTQFMTMMTDPFGAGRAGDVNGGATGFADESESMAYASRAKSKSPRDAFAAFTKAPPRAALLDPRWSVWAAGFGGSQTTDGKAITGSNTTTSAIYSAAVGADYWFSHDTVAGFALAGGGTNYSVAGGGSGRSDLFQAGAFVRQNFGATYLTASAAYGWQDVTTDRYVTAAGADHLRAEFNANSYSGRLELGHRFLPPWFGLGVSPYAAAQITAFELPSYAERTISGASTFALNYGGDTSTSSRTELGLRTDKSYALDGAVLTLRGRAAWAHDFNPDRAIAATFQALPGASFVVNGAALASDSALTTASAEVRWMNGWSVAATFEGEFSDVTRSYAGKGVMRYAW